ncbi:MAG: DPP IV N-terminal domain-containing protein [Candidatus Omnitrophota bacterium]|nr:DPP IV N-terminal domain-containing protein [Candidatus Omnitrophota bacterium]MDZ4241316.1 DPP IV N-terminal domain-containing protein [Candidatus Omnitrophota bacterium]
MDLKGTIVFVSGRHGDYDVFTVELPSGEIDKLTTGDSWNDMPKWSPDGRKIAYISNKSGTAEIWVMNADGSEKAQITKSGKHHQSPDWSPDGRKLVFCANYHGHMDVYTMNADGSDLAQITDYEGMDFTPNFSPDGRRIIFASKRSGNSDLWAYEIATKSLRQLTEFRGRDYSPAFSPDGSRIAFVTGLAGADGKENLEIYVMDSDGKNEKRVTTNLGIDRHVGWSPDGRFLVFASNQPRSTVERLWVADTQTPDIGAIRFDRKALEREIGAEAKGAFFFQFLPEPIRRKFYPENFFGTDRYPDWTS